MTTARSWLPPVAEPSNTFGVAVPRSSRWLPATQPTMGWLSARVLGASAAYRRWTGEVADRDDDAEAVGVRVRGDAIEVARAVGGDLDLAHLIGQFVDMDQVVADLAAVGA